MPGPIQLSAADVRMLYQCLFGGPVPDNQTLEDAATACAFVVGVEYVEETLFNCKKAGVK